MKYFTNDICIIPHSAIMILQREGLHMAEKEGVMRKIEGMVVVPFKRLLLPANAFNPTLALN